MKKFACGSCGRRVYFENMTCLPCGAPLGFDPDRVEMIALKRQRSGNFREARAKSGAELKYCSNVEHGTCNWLVPANDPTGLCRACDLNRFIPNLNSQENVEAWRALEAAKKRLVYALLRFRLPLDGNRFGKGPLTFDFVHAAQTGHADGVITINVAEADSVERERQRQQLGEPYRSLLGHLRHESGHYYWMLLVDAGHKHDEFRRLFGDEREDYGTAVGRHQFNGPPADWRMRNVSAYASAHPWEDWAETWAHYFHMVDALETAEMEGLEPRAAGFFAGSVWPFKTFDVYRSETLAALLERWVPLTLAVNSLNRSMGHEDFYPFVIPDAAVAKLDFIHRLIRGAQRG